MWICENSGWNLTDPAALPVYYFMTFYFNSTAISELIIIILNACFFFLANTLRTVAGQRLDGRKNVQYNFYNNHVSLSAALTQVQCGLVVCVMDEQTEECRVCG